VKMDILGLGVSTVDFLARVDHLPFPGEVIKADEMILQGGGPVATAMTTVARLGGKPGMLDALGDDWLGQFILEEFNRDRVSCSGIRVRKGYTSSTAMVLVQKVNGERSIIFRPGTASELTAEEVLTEELSAAAYLHVNGRHWDACNYAVRQARKLKIKVSFDGGAYRYRTEMDDLISQVDICIVARQFALSFSREDQTEKAAKTILRAGPALVVITDGTRGSMVYPHGEKGFHQPAFIMPDVVDTTGCGDAYHGAFLFGLAHGMSMIQTARLASAVAALNTRRLGGKAALPDLETAEAFINSSVHER
jgi:sugar/nucleoside kinase (ribokinase family)